MIFEDNFSRGDTKSGDRPWRDDLGNVRDKEELRELAKSWTASTWERFLEDTEPCKGKDSIDEVVIDPVVGEAIFSRQKLEDFMSGQTLKILPTLGATLRVALKALTPNQQRILIMKFWKGKSTSQIARELNLSRSTVKTLIERSIAKVRKNMLNLTADRSAEFPTSSSTLVSPQVEDDANDFQQIES